MTRINYIAPLFAAAALVGCDSPDNTVVLGPDGSVVNEAAEVNSANVELPPAIAASKIYRCKDNSVVYVDWLSDKTSANFRAEQGANPTLLKAAAEGEPLTAEGYSLEGTAEASSITLTRPDKGAQSCSA